MPRITPTHQVAEVLRLASAGLADAHVSERTGVPVSTIRLWRRRGVPKAAQRELAGEPVCQDCGADEHVFSELPARAYSYGFGLYLGDGTLTRVRTSWSLRIFLDAAYPGIVDECATVIAQLRGHRPQLVRRSGQNYFIVTSNWRSWGCLFPQRGPGMKHTRRIALEPWQRRIVHAEPGAFLRGLIHSDGWRGVNRVRSKGKNYEYHRYQFSNRSDDIRGLFTEACDVLGIAWSPWTRFHISVARRDAVARLDEYVGPKY